MQSAVYVISRMGQLLLGATSLIAKICKARFLRIAVFGAARSKSDSGCKAVNVCFHLSEQVISQVQRMHTFRPTCHLLLPAQNCHWLQEPALRRSLPDADIRESHLTEMAATEQLTSVFAAGHRELRSTLPFYGG